MSKDPTIGCGISTIWQTRDDDPLGLACADHDAKYQNQIGTQKEADQAFCEDVFKIAEQKDSLYLKIKAKIYCGLVRLLGSRFWGDQGENRETFKEIVLEKESQKEI